MTKEEYEKIKDSLLFIIEEGETKETAKATASLLELEDAWRRSELMGELDADETEEDYDEGEETDYGADAAGDCQAHAHRL